MNSRISQLTAEAIQHLEQERALLVDLEKFATTLHESLLNHPNFEVATLDEFEKQLTPRVEDLSRKRTELKAKIAGALQIPFGDATIGVLTEKSDDEKGAALREMRQSVRQQAIELHGRAAESGSLAFRLWWLIERVTQELNGATPPAATYDRKGLRRVA